MLPLFFNHLPRRAKSQATQNMFLRRWCFDASYLRRLSSEVCVTISYIFIHNMMCVGARMWCGVVESHISKLPYRHLTSLCCVSNVACYKKLLEHYNNGPLKCHEHFCTRLIFSLSRDYMMPITPCCSSYLIMIDS